MTIYEPSLASLFDTDLDAAPQVPASSDPASEIALETSAATVSGKGIHGHVYKPSGAAFERSEGVGCGEAVGRPQEGGDGSGGTNWNAYGDGDASFAVGDTREPELAVSPTQPEPKPITDKVGIVGMHHSRVDLSPFQMPRAKIDRIDFRCGPEDLNRAGRARIRKGLKHGTLTNVPKKVLDARGPHLQINDPSVEDLQYLVENFHDSDMLRVEIAIDLHLDGPMRDEPLHALRDQLRHCLYPQKHELLRGAKRKVFRTEKKRYAADGLGQPLPPDAGQLIWEDHSTGCQLAVYIKTEDQGQRVDRPFVRLEVRFSPGACRRIGLQKVGLIPRFVPNMRTLMSDMIFVAQGFKNGAALLGRGVPKSPWNKLGAQWNAKGRAILDGDVFVNRRLREAVNNLRTKLTKIQPPSALAEDYDAWCVECDSEWLVPTPPNSRP